MQQLSIYDILEVTKEIKNYDWLQGNPVNLRIYFKEELQRKNLSDELKIDAKKRLRQLEAQ